MKLSSTSLVLSTLKSSNQNTLYIEHRLAFLQHDTKKMCLKKSLSRVGQITYTVLAPVFTHQVSSCIRIVHVKIAKSLEK